MLISQSIWSEESGMTKVLFNHLYKMSLSVNFPKASGSRSQAWLRFYLITWIEWMKGSTMPLYNKWTYCIFRLFTFQGRGIICLSKSSRKYAPILATEVMRYGPSQLGPSFPHFRFLAAPRTFLNTKSPSISLNISYYLSEYAFKVPPSRMDKDSRESMGRGTLLQVIKQEPKARVSPLKESMEFVLRPSNHLITTGPKLDGNTLHIKVSSLE